MDRGVLAFFLPQLPLLSLQKSSTGHYSSVKQPPLSPCKLNGNKVLSQIYKMHPIPCITLLLVICTASLRDGGHCTIVQELFLQLQSNIINFRTDRPQAPRALQKTMLLVTMFLMERSEQFALHEKNWELLSIFPGCQYSTLVVCYHGQSMHSVKYYARFVLLECLASSAPCN